MKYLKYMKKNKFEFFRPLMFEHEYRFIEKYLDKNDILLEWGSGNGTIYFSDLVKNIISIEHDKNWVNNIKTIIDIYNIKNITIHHIAAHSPEPIPCRYEQFKDYIEFPKKKKLKFTKVLIDGRARKYCAKSIYDIIDNDTIVFIHDFNRPDYQKVLKYFDIIEYDMNGQGIVALNKKKQIIEDISDY